MKLTDEYVVCSLEDAEAFAQKRNITVKGETMKPNYVAEAPYHPGYEDAVVTEPRPVLYGIYKSKPLSDEEIFNLTAWKKNPYELYVEMEKEDMIAFARAIEERHGIK